MCSHPGHQLRLVRRTPNNTRWSSPQSKRTPRQNRQGPPSRGQGNQAQKNGTSGPIKNGNNYHFVGEGSSNSAAYIFVFNVFSAQLYEIIRKTAHSIYSLMVFTSFLFICSLGVSFVFFCLFCFASHRHAFHLLEILPCHPPSAPSRTRLTVLGAITDR